MQVTDKWQKNYILQQIANRKQKPKQSSNARWLDVKSNPLLNPSPLYSEEEGQTFPWHSYATQQNSSQAFCVRAFGALRFLKCRNKIVAELISRAELPQIDEKRSRRIWTVGLEVEDESLLGEYGVRQPTSIDVLCASTSEVIAIESKFDCDATDGFGKCRQAYPKEERPAACKGYYGPHSDCKRPDNLAWCRLESWEGRRSPRLYWTLGRMYFRPEIFSQNSTPCPFAGASYQLMRNFLYAGAMAQRERKVGFGVLAICPNVRKELLEQQVRDFCTQVLQERFASSLRLVTYETYIRILRDSGDQTAVDLAAFLEETITKLQ